MFSSWPGFVPAIHVFLLACDKTWKPGHDERIRNAARIHGAFTSSTLS
jgi:hypothetical protein